MNKNKNRQEELFCAYDSYTSFVSQLSCYALPLANFQTAMLIYSGDAVSDDDFSIEGSLNATAKDLLTDGIATRILYLFESEDVEKPQLGILSKQDFQKYKGNVLYSEEVRLKTKELLISRWRIKTMKRRLSNSHLSPSMIAKDDISRLQKYMSDVIGRHVHWQQSSKEKFTKSFILIQRAERTILAVKVFRLMELRINAFLKRSPYDMRISIPLHPLKEVTNQLP